MDRRIYIIMYLFYIRKGDFGCCCGVVFGVPGVGFGVGFGKLFSVLLTLILKSVHKKTSLQNLGKSLWFRWF